VTGSIYKSVGRYDEMRIGPAPHIGKMTLTILSTHSKAIQKLVKEQMRQEAEELGFNPYDDSGQEEFERRVMDLEQQSLDHPEIDWEVKYWELAGHR